MLKVRTITYLLEQPVVKKMSPQLKLKPVKIDELDGESRPNQARNNGANGAAPARSPRPAFEGGERPPRDQARETRDRDRGPRPERAEGDRAPREGGFDRGPRNDRGERGDRFGGGRDRGERGGRGHDRHERGDRGERSGGRDGGDRNRNRSESFGSEREPAQADAGARPAPLASEAPSVSHSPAPAALSPRRPLPSTVEHETEPREIPGLNSAAANAAAEDALFARDESDMQHGRRNQLKKKPRFEVAEEEAKTTEETKA
ncbi:MAG TPA: hypothetical protein VJ385_22885 [Fibrobacteria bacterium]|nr:hypothetical protein [Fibrobacteria bacterium]